MKLSHYTDASPWAFDPMRRYRVDDPWHKPVGLWLSVDGEHDWPAWCTGERWGLEKLAQRHSFSLMAVSRLLHIASTDEIDLFHRRYAEILPGMERYRSEYVNWHRVSAEFDGVIIAPYIWARRLDGPAHRWYYGWDCASGCIWNLRSVRFLGSQPFAPANAEASE